MNELLQVFTAFGVMVAGDGHQSLTRIPIACEKQIYRKIDPFLLRDENGRLGEDIVIDRQDDGPQKYFYTYKVHDTSGVERSHIYHVSTSKDCQQITVKKL